MIARREPQLFAHSLNLKDWGRQIQISPAIGILAQELDLHPTGKQSGHRGTVCVITKSLPLHQENPTVHRQQPINCNAGEKSEKKLDFLEVPNWRGLRGVSHGTRFKVRISCVWLRQHHLDHSSAGGQGYFLRHFFAVAGRTQEVSPWGADRNCYRIFSQSEPVLYNIGIFPISNLILNPKFY